MKTIGEYLQEAVNDALPLLDQWRWINEHGWDEWDNRILAHGREGPDQHRHRIISGTGSALSHIRGMLYCIIPEEWPRDIVAFHNALALESERAKETCRVERGRLFPRLKKYGRGRKEKAEIRASLTAKKPN
jgi:hypothetical protein